MNTNMEKSDRFSGFLTRTDWEEHLSTMEEINSDNRHPRLRIRQRAARALRDLVRLERQLPEGDDRRMIFETLLDTELWDSEPDRSEVMRDLFTFLLRIHAPDHQVIPAEIERWLEHAIRASKHPNVAAYVDVDITIRDTDMLDNWESFLVRDKKDFLEFSQKKGGKPLEALLQTGRITPEDYMEYSDPGDEWDEW